MSTKHREIRTKAEKAIEKMEGLINKKGVFTDADELEFAKLEAETNVYKSSLKQIHRTWELEEELKMANNTIENLSPAKRAKLERVVLCHYLRDGALDKELHSIMRPSNVRLANEQSTSGGSGGYTIPKGFQNELEVAIKSYGGMWEASRVIKTTRGNTMPWSTTDDSDHKAYLVSESEAMDADAERVLFGKQDFDGFKYTSGIIQVPNELLEDSELFPDEFIRVLSERIFRGTNDVFSIGDGSGKPKGVLPAATLGCHSANDSTLAYNDFVNLLHTVDPGYRKSDKAVWMFHDSVLKEARNIVDLSERPKFSNLDAGIILGHPFIVNNDLPEFTPGSSSGNDNDKTILFGDFSRYIIRTIKEMRIIRLGQRFADLDQTAFVVIFRVDGDLLDAGRHPIKHLRISAT
jgi:HK97 family phage major capsid protein